MARSKIVNESEVLRWMEEGKPYGWMVEEYRRKYDIETTRSLWANFRQRRGLTPRLQRDENLIPWAVKEEHRWKNPIIKLRSEARRRAGLPQSDSEIEKLRTWLAGLDQDELVVLYEPDTEEGFFYVPREADDDDIIRRPDRVTRERRPYQ